MTNKNNTTLYVGVTSNLVQRVFQHKGNLIEGFTKKYNLTKLVYFEEFDDINQSIAREKQLKAGSRSKKEALIGNMNSKWEDLYEAIL